MGVSSDDLFKPAPAQRPVRQHGAFHALSPFLWAPAMYTMRFATKGRMQPNHQHALFGGMVLCALSHAGYIMFSDSSV